VTQPDANTWLILLFNCIAYVIMWFRKGQKDATTMKEHRQMYADYKIAHKIKENGGYSGE
jgi:preprotein translocase subunit YajC